MPMSSLTVESAYREMARIRVFEERVLEMSLAGEIAGSVHLCFGQEAIPVGACSALQPHDQVLSTYRGHGWALATGAPALEVLAEIAQRSGGTNGGRAGSPLLSHPDSGFLGENSIVAAGVPIAAGVGLANAHLRNDSVVLSSIGDGAMNQGAATEGMVFAAARNLPVIFVCENNGWSEMTPISATTRGADLAVRAAALGIDSHVVDGDDPFAVSAAVAQAAERCRAGGGPVFLEFKTHRLKGHYNRDIEHYRPAEDRAAAQAADPIARLRSTAIAEGTMAEAVFDEIDAEVRAEVGRLVDAVREMPLPDPASAHDHVYGAETELASSDRDEVREMTYQRAVNAALRTELEQRPELLVYGEDVGFAGGIFGVTRGLQKDFGEGRVFDTPIAESAILGSAVGSAISGLRPVIEIMWADFVFVALDQIINQASNVRYVSRGRLTAPLTIRMQQGVTPGSCAQHSQNIEAILAHIPGIKVGLPVTPQDAYDMLRAAIADPDPTIVIEHRALYQSSGDVATSGRAAERAEGARLRRAGTDVAVVAWGTVVDDALAAAEQLEAEDIDVAVLDLRWVRPLDMDAVERAVRGAGGRVVVAHQASGFAGFGAEVAAQITERLFAELTTPVVRVTGAEARIPSAPVLQAAVIPSATTIAAAVRNAASSGARP